MGGPSRRTVLGGAAGAAAGAATAGFARAPSGAGKQATFVLVHGTWHGSWVWRDVRQRLEALGHRVIAPTCTGCGDRAHLIGPEVGLETHITDITNTLTYAEAEDVILVGHSFSGLTITGAADRMRERVRRIVFFDALVPFEDRMSGVPRDPDTGAFPDWWETRKADFRDGHRMVLWDHYPVEMLVPESETEHVARLKRLITHHPVAQWTDVLTLSNGGWEGLNPTFIHCVGQTYRQTSDLMVGPARGPDWTYIPIDTPRNAMMTHPDLVTDVFLQLAET